MASSAVPLVVLDAPRASATTPAVAVMPVAGADAHGAEAAIRGAVGESARVKPVDADTVAHLIERAGASGISCDAARTDCAARICAFGGLDFAIVARIQSGRATLVLQDCADGRKVRSVSALLGDKTRDAGLAALTHAVLGETEARGRIRVTAPADGVVVVDGAPGGAAPLAFSLAVGPHQVEWRPNTGGPPQRKTVEVPAAAQVDVAFAEGDAAPSSSWQTSIAVGGVAVGGVLAVGGGIGALLAAPADRAHYSAQQYNDAVTLGRALLGVGVAGVVVAAVAGGALLLASSASSDREAPP